MQALRADDRLRRFLLREPRGSVAAHANLIVPATRADCAFGYVIMEPTEYPLMSGSNTICVATVLLETGMVELREPETVLRLEAPAGIVEVRAACRDGRVESVELTNVPAFVELIDTALEVEGLGTIGVDVAFGGMWYAIADAGVLGFELVPAEARDLCRVGELIRVAAREQLAPVHPENPEIAGVSIVQIAEPWRGVGEASRNAVVVAPGRLDRRADDALALRINLAEGDEELGMLAGRPLDEVVARRAHRAGARFELRHLAGQAFGSLVEGSTFCGRLLECALGELNVVGCP